MNSMVTLDNVRAGYGSAEVLHGVSFELKEGECLGVIGPNGCGKTTLLRAIAGILPFSGEIRLGGAGIKKMRPKLLARKVAMLPQATQFFFNYTVAETVMMGRYAHMDSSLFGGETENDRRTVSEALNAASLSDLGNRTVDTLSGGQRQRVLLAKIIAQNPEIVLLDEPTNHLDLSCQVDIISFLRKWAKDEQKTIIAVLHDINSAAFLSDRLVLMEGGSVVACGETAKVLSSDALIEAYKMDVASYMLGSFKRWENINNVQKNEPASTP